MKTIELALLIGALVLALVPGLRLLLAVTRFAMDTEAAAVIRCVESFGAACASGTAATPAAAALHTAARRVTQAALGRSHLANAVPSAPRAPAPLGAVPATAAEESSSAPADPPDSSAPPSQASATVPEPQRPAPAAAAALQNTSEGELGVSNLRPLSANELQALGAIPPGHLRATYRHPLSRGPDQIVQEPITFSLGDLQSGTPYGYHLRLDNNPSRGGYPDSITGSVHNFLLTDAKGNWIEERFNTYRLADHNGDGPMHLWLEAAGRPLVSPAAQRALKEAAVKRLAPETQAAVRHILGNGPSHNALPGEVADYQLAAAKTWEFLVAQGASREEATVLAKNLLGSVFHLETDRWQFTGVVLSQPNNGAGSPAVGLTAAHVVGPSTRIDGHTWFGSQLFNFVSKSGSRPLAKEVALFAAPKAPKHSLSLGNDVQLGRAQDGENILVLGHPALNDSRGLVATVGVVAESTMAGSPNFTSLRVPGGRYQGNSGGLMFTWRKGTGLVATGLVSAQTEWRPGAAETLLLGPTGGRVDEIRQATLAPDP